MSVLEPQNLGVSEHKDFKYYMDISQITFHEEQEHILKMAHVFQINRLMDSLNRLPSSARTEPASPTRDFPFRT